MISTRVRNIEVSAIKQMPLIARTIANTISLGQGIPSLPTPRYIREGIIELLQQDSEIGKYSLQPGLPKLKEVVANRLSGICERFVDPEKEIVITAGAMEGLLAAITTITERGDEVILFDPSYASHIEQVKFAEGVPVFVPLLEHNGWALDERLLEAAINNKTRAIIVCNPCNPTGKVFTADELESIVAVACKHNLFVIADETYEFLLYDGIVFRSLMRYEKIREHLILCRSFSKEFAMTGWRVGYVYAREDIMDQLLKVHDAAVICAPTISQYAAYIAMTGKPYHDDENVVTALSERRKILCERLDRLTDLFSYTKPYGAYYVLARYKKTFLNSKEFSMKLLRETGVITIPGIAFGPQGEQHIRMSFGGTPEEMNEACDRIASWNNTL